MEPMALSGLERLMDVCQRLNLGLETSPPAREPLTAGNLLEGVPLLDGLTIGELAQPEDGFSQGQKPPQSLRARVA